MNSEPSSKEAHPDPSQAQGWPWSRIALGLLGVLAFMVLARAVGAQLPVWAEWIQSLGAWGPAAFILLYSSAVVLFVPGSILTLAGGAIFGVTFGTLYVITAAVLGSCISFLIARYLARGWVETKLQQNARFDAVARAVGENGLKITFLLRLSPAFPFSFMNYALGLTRVSFRDYLFASVGMLPGTLLFVYSGRIIGDVAALAGGVTSERGWGEYAVLGIGLLATLAVATLVARIAKRALNEIVES